MTKPEDTNKVTQKSNTVGGDQAGRDVNKTTYNIGAISSGGVSQLECLYTRLEEERRSNTTIDEIIEELQHYRSHASHSDVLGLEAKLENGNREAYLTFAMEVKERFAKKLLSNEHSETAQEIYALLLGKVYTRFQIDIAPKLREGHPDEVINTLIVEHIIRPLEDILGGNLLRIYEPEIYGMIYFLTGNCHLNWN